MSDGDLPLAQKPPEQTPPEPQREPPEQAPPSPPQELTLQQRQQWAMLVHLATFSGYVGLPLGNIFGPLLVWQIKKEEMPELEAHAKDAMNFHLTMTIGMVISLVFTVFCFVGIIPLLGLGLYSTVMSVVVGLAANDGKPARYPGSIRLIP
jgi:uncharacterized Tic20 family protein